MAVRVPKTGASGGVEFTQGSQPLHISELDGDLDALFNGGITDSNLAIGANIATSKLASDAGITSAMLGANSVTTAKIANLNVLSGKLAINATGPALSSGQISNGGTTIQNTTATMITLASMTTRGGRVVLIGTVSGQWVITNTSSSASWVLLRDGVAIATWNHQSLLTGAGTSIQIPGHFSPIFIDLAPS